MRDALVPGTRGEPAQDLTRHASSLPAVHDGNGHFGRLRLLFDAHVAGDTRQLVARSLRNERLVIVVVDIGQVLDEAALSRFIGERKRRYLDSGDRASKPRTSASASSGPIGRMTILAPSRKVTCAGYSAAAVLEVDE